MRNPKKFSPTPAMEFYAYQRAKLGDDAFQNEIAQQALINQFTVSHWKQKEGFNEWLEERTKYYRAPIRDLLEQVAIANLKDFRFWEAIAIKFGYLSPEEQAQQRDAKPIHITRAEMLDLIEVVLRTSTPLILHSQS